MKHHFAKRALSCLVAAWLVAACATPTPPSPAPATPSIVRAFKNLNRTDALKLTHDRFGAIESLISPKADPYFGKHDSGPTCDPAKRPTNIADQANPNFQFEIQLYASENHVYGLCDAMIEKLKSRVSWYYCAANETLFEIKDFYLASDAWKTRAAYDCHYFKETN